MSEERTTPGIPSVADVRDAVQTSGITSEQASVTVRRSRESVLSYVVQIPIASARRAMLTGPGAGITAWEYAGRIGGRLGRKVTVESTQDGVVLSTIVLAVL